AEPTQAGPRTVKLQPRVRIQPTLGPIPTLSVEAITPLLNHPGVMTEKELEDLPYVAALDDEHLVGGLGNRIFARALPAGDVTRYRLIRRGAEYRDPKTDKFLGIEIIDVGDVLAERFGDPATLRVTRAQLEIRVGDRLIPLDNGRKSDYNFLPRAPEFPVDAHIIGAIGSMSRIGQYQVVAISAGTQDKIEAGHVLVIYEAGNRVVDPINEADGPRKFRLPERRAGYAVVFRPFEKVSYALVMVAEHEIRVRDNVRTP
ncbi:MAG: hypothetical protein OEW08_09060, partial [Gammaproteobacteria bacterium]|nr:hypothetical protein [Gammaproteobacteria bacterium]